MPKKCTYLTLYWTWTQTIISISKHVAKMKECISIFRNVITIVLSLSETQRFLFCKHAILHILWLYKYFLLRIKDPLWSKSLSQNLRGTYLYTFFFFLNMSIRVSAMCNEEVKRNIWNPLKCDVDRMPRILHSVYIFTIYIFIQMYLCNCKYFWGYLCTYLYCIYSLLSLKCFCIWNHWNYLFGPPKHRTMFQLCVMIQSKLTTQ